MHGQPDYGAQAAKQTIGSLADMAELAARLGSINTFDRRGDVMFIDGFESGLAPYYPFCGGTGCNVRQNSEYSRNGGFSCKLTTGSDGTRQATILRICPYPVLGNLGFEISFTMQILMETYDFTLRLEDNLIRYTATIRYDEVNDSLQYLDEDGNYIDIETELLMYKHVHLFNTLKMVVDFTNREYVRLMINEHSWSLADIPLRSEAAAWGDRISARLTCTGQDDGNNHYIFADDFIITQNEP